MRKFFMAAAAAAAAVAVSVAPVTAAPAGKAVPVPGGPLDGAPVLELVQLDGDRATGGDVTATAATLPFNFTFNFSTTLSSRNFWPSSAGKACVSLRGTGSSDPNWRGKEIKVEMWDADGIDSRIGAPVRYRLDGGYYGYCWSALYTNHEHYFKLVKEWGPASVQGDGWASAT